MGMDEIVNSGEIINKEIDWNMFKVNRRYFNKVSRNILLSSILDDMACDIIDITKVKNSFKGDEAAKIFYKTLNDALQYLDCAEKEDFSGSRINEIVPAYRFTSFILRDYDVEDKANIPKARIAINTLKDLITTVPPSYSDRKKLANLLLEYSEILSEARVHPEANHSL